MPWNKLIVSGSDAHLNTMTASANGSPIAMPNIQQQAIGNPNFRPLVVDNTTGKVWKLDESYLSEQESGQSSYARYFVSQSNLGSSSISFTNDGYETIDVVIDQVGSNFHTSMLNTSSMDKGFLGSSGNNPVQSGSYRKYWINVYCATGAGGGNIIFTSGQDATPGGQSLQFVQDGEVISYEIWLNDYPLNGGWVEATQWSPQGQILARI